MSEARPPPERTADVRRRSTIRTRLLLLLCGLLLATVAIHAAWTYTEVRRSVLESEATQIESAAFAFERALAPVLETGMKDLKTVADEDAVRAAAQRTEGDAMAVARERLRSLLARSPSVKVAELWSADGERRLRVAYPQVGEGEVPPALHGLDGPAPMSAGIGPLRFIGESAYTEAVVDVQPAEALGTGSTAPARLLVRSEIGSNVGRFDLVRQLISKDARLLIGNRTGDAWTDWASRVRGPAVDPLDPSQRIHRGHDGEERVGVGVVLRGTPWVVWIDREAESVLAPVRTRSLVRASIMAGVLLLLVGAGAWWISGRISKPLVATTEAVEAMADGALDRRLTPAGDDEIQRLVAAFNTMAGRVSRRTEEVEQARDRYRALYEDSPEMLVSVDVETGRIVRCNRTLARRTGYSEEALKGRRALAFVDRSARQEATSAFERLVRRQLGVHRRGPWDRVRPGQGEPDLSDVPATPQPVGLPRQRHRPLRNASHRGAARGPHVGGVRAGSGFTVPLHIAGRAPGAPAACRAGPGGAHAG
jgi:PAS domain S-box-containing protein